MSTHSIPRVKLLNASLAPFSDVVSAARTCYSKQGIILPKQINNELAHNEKNPYKPLVASLYQAGHHTTFQHTYLHFSIENVSRNCIWSFLHSHPFYNSEQVSQRYVKVRQDQFFLAEGLNETQTRHLRECYEFQIGAYQKINRQLKPLVESQYLKRFKARKGSKRARREVGTYTREVGRYVLPIGTTAYLHHTISLITLMRYYRLAQVFDLPLEQKALVNAMMKEALGEEQALSDVIEESLSLEDTLEYKFLEDFANSGSNFEFISEFDQGLKGKISTLVDYKVNQEQTLAQSIREVTGVANHDLAEGQLIDYVLSSKCNPLLGEPMNLNTHSKLMRTLLHSQYTFRKKLSHTADSQDQRHRMTPGSRPILKCHFTGNPDYIVPSIITQEPETGVFYKEIMEKTWDYVRQGLGLGMNFEQASYMLPNSLAIRFSESADILNLKHKMAMRLCYNAQEEIWRASLEEATQITEVHPLIGKHFLPPCTPRFLSKSKPICPEGERFCGVPVWKLDRNHYQRTI
jgi:thymidylate synthase ThyX